MGSVHVLVLKMAKMDCQINGNREIALTEDILCFTSHNVPNKHTRVKGIMMQEYFHFLFVNFDSRELFSQPFNEKGLACMSSFLL